MQIGQLNITSPPSNSRYDPLLIPHLEKYLQQQTPAQYDQAANLALLKLYQFSPEKINTELVQKILVKSLVRVPSSDFTLCLYLLQDDKVNNDAVVQALVQLYSLLESVQFDQYWKARNSLDAKVNDALQQHVDKFDQHIREFILGVVKITYYEIETPLLLKHLNLQDISEVQALGKDSVSMAQADITRFAPNEFNQIQTQKKVPQPVKFEQLALILNSLK
jgi:translation initiation factor 3 subunit K